VAETDPAKALGLWLALLRYVTPTRRSTPGDDSHRRRMTKREILIGEIVARSVAKSWETARREWDLLHVYEADDAETHVYARSDMPSWRRSSRRRGGSELDLNQRLPLDLLWTYRGHSRLSWSTISAIRN
jgi:hypothetical protein